MTAIPETTPAGTASIVPTTGENFDLSAQNPAEMVQCHAKAIEWCRRKIELVQNEVTELKVSFEHALAHKWKSTTLKKHWGYAEKRLAYYVKMLKAFEAGYYIVPNFPATVFAIRTDRDTPDATSKIAYTYAPMMTQKGKTLPAGEGVYKNPEPNVMMIERTLDDGHGGKKTVADYWADSWDALEFPANMAKLHVMEAATRAMALKLFDEILMLPSDRQRHADPMLLGRISLRSQYGTNRTANSATFMLAWHIDTKTL